MAKASLAKKAVTLAWSIGLGVVLIMITTVVILPSTKSASPRAKPSEESGAGAPVSTFNEDDAFHHLPSSKRMAPPSFFNGEGAPPAEVPPSEVPEIRSEPAVSDDDRPIMFGSKAPVVPLFNGEIQTPAAPSSGDESPGKLVPIDSNPSGGVQPTPPATLGPPLGYNPYNSELVEPAAEDPPGPPSQYQSQGSPYGQRPAASKGGTP